MRLQVRNLMTKTKNTTRAATTTTNNNNNNDSVGIVY